MSPLDLLALTLADGLAGWLPEADLEADHPPERVTLEHVGAAIAQALTVELLTTTASLCDQSRVEAWADLRREQAMAQATLEARAEAAALRLEVAELRALLDGPAAALVRVSPPVGSGYALAIEQEQEEEEEPEEQELELEEEEPPPRLARMSPAARGCTHRACQEPHHSGGLCASHWQRRRRALTYGLPESALSDYMEDLARPKAIPRRNKGPRTPAPAPTPEPEQPQRPQRLQGVTDRHCTEPGCKRVANARGLCRPHWAKRRDAGTLPESKHAKNHSDTPTRCTAPGCSKDHMARGLCSTHWNQISRGSRLAPVRSLKWRSMTPPAVCPVEGCANHPVADWRWCRVHDAKAQLLNWKAPTTYLHGQTAPADSVGAVGQALLNARSTQPATEADPVAPSTTVSNGLVARRNQARPPVSMRTPPPRERTAPPPPMDGVCLVKGCARSEKLDHLCSLHVDQLRFRRPDKGLRSELRKRPELRAAAARLPRESRLGVAVHKRENPTD